MYKTILDIEEEIRIIDESIEQLDNDYVIDLLSNKTIELKELLHHHTTLENLQFNLEHNMTGNLSSDRNEWTNLYKITNISDLITALDYCRKFFFKKRLGLK